MVGKLVLLVGKLVLLVGKLVLLVGKLVLCPLYALLYLRFSMSKSI
jgi:hypothetical protein